MHSSNNKRHLLICLGLALAFCLYHGLKVNDRGTGDDAREFWATAYHIQRHNSFSMQHTQGVPDKLDAYRPPVYPLLMAGVIELVPELRTSDFSWLFNPPPGGGDPVPPASLKTMKYLQVLFYLGAAFTAMALLIRFTGNRNWGYAAFVLTAIHPFMDSFVNRYYSELTATVLVGLFALLFHQAVRRRNLGWFAVAGLCLGVLTLTRAQWYYVGPACGLYAVLVGLIRKNERKALGRLTAGALLMCLLMFLLVLPWKERNQEQFGRGFITERAGIALDLRSRYSLMTGKEILASFLYWTRMSELRDDLLPRLMDRADYRNLIREEGYYFQALQRSGELEAQYPRAEADLIQFREAAHRLLSHPLHYLRSLPSLTYRGMIDGHLSVFNLLIWAACFAVVWKLLRRGEWEQLAAYAPLMALWGFNSLVTHGLSRYNGTGSVLLVVALTHYFWLRREKRRAGKEEPPYDPRSTRER
ncbi:MAG: glycosyltransferase family 39 protein [Desulfovibrionaceae bacterium]